MERKKEGLFKKRRFLFGVGSALLLVLVLVLGFSVFGVYMKYTEAKAKKEALESEMAALEAREAVLSKKLERFTSDRGVEEEIRSKFQVAKEGEGVILLIEEGTEIPAPVVDSRSVWQKMLGWFGL